MARWRRWASPASQRRAARCGRCDERLKTVLTGLLPLTPTPCGGGCTAVEAVLAPLRCRSSLGACHGTAPPATCGTASHRPRQRACALSTNQVFQHAEYRERILLTNAVGLMQAWASRCAHIVRTTYCKCMHAVASCTLLANARPSRPGLGMVGGSRRLGGARRWRRRRLRVRRARARARRLGGGGVALCAARGDATVDYAHA